MSKDFDNLNRDLRIGGIFIVFVICVFLISFIVILEDEKKGLQDQINERDLSIKEINKTSYNRFIIAKDLTEICNLYKSSRDAKEKYYFNK